MMWLPGWYLVEETLLVGRILSLIKGKKLSLEVKEK